MHVMNVLLRLMKPCRKYEKSPPVYCLLLIFAIFWYRRCTQIPVEFLDLYEKLSTLEPGSAGCKLPKLDPWDKSIVQYVSDTPLLNCKALQPALTFVTDAGALEFNRTELEPYGGEKHNLKCQYREFRHNSGVDDESVFYYDWKDLPFNGAQMKEDFVQVRCYKDSMLSLSPIYLYNHALIYRKNKNVGKSVSDGRPSVLLFGIDSMSRSNFIRKLPKTHEFLMKQNNSVNLEGYIKVGDNTNINWIAALVGLRVGSTVDFKEEIHDEWGKFYDNWANFIWKQFAALNYITLFAEDRPDISNFNYLGKAKGFKNAPTNHYFRTFMLATYWTSLHRRSKAFCYNHLADHNIQLDYVARFVREYSKQRYWGLNWLQALSHEVLNPIGVADQDILTFFQTNWDYFNETLLVIFSDHGHRYDSIRESIIGRLEARLPYMTIVVPEYLRSKYPWILENLRYNVHRMTTPFDLYETMQDIIHRKYEVQDNGEQKLSVRGHSLFRRIPSTRRCADAHVPNEFCPCSTHILLNQTHHDYTNAAVALTGILNSLLETRAPGKCVKLELGDIKSVHAALPHPSTIKDPQVSNRMPSSGFYMTYIVVVKMTPPTNGLFESTILKDWSTGEWSLYGDVERNNKYGNTSLCVSDRLLVKICHCITIT